MITKKEILLFSISCIAVFIFVFSGTNDQEVQNITFNTKEDALFSKGAKFKNLNFSKRQDRRTKKKSNDFKAFRKRLSKSNLTKAIEKATEALPTIQDTEKSANKKTTVAKNTKKKKDDKKKKKGDKEKKKKKEVAKKDKKDLKPLSPTSPTAHSKTTAQNSDVESADLSSFSFTTQIPTATNQSSTTADLTQEEEENSETNSIEASESSDTSVSSLGTSTPSTDTQKSIFTSLLEAERFTEFEQLMQSNLSEEKRIQAYQDALNVLFSSDEEKAQEYDSFIYNHFFNDKYAVIISKSLISSEITTEQTNYSVAYLNQIVIDWSSETGNATFAQIYQNNVASILSENEEKADLFSGLQSSIEAKSLLLSENTIEVSAN